MPLAVFPKLCDDQRKGAGADESHGRNDEGEPGHRIFKNRVKD